MMGFRPLLIKRLLDGYVKGKGRSIRCWALAEIGNKENRRLSVMRIEWSDIYSSPMLTSKL
jgi:hypothetical protein